MNGRPNKGKKDMIDNKYFKPITQSIPQAYRNPNYPNPSTKHTNVEKDVRNTRFSYTTKAKVK